MELQEFLTKLAMFVATDPRAEPRITEGSHMLRIGNDCPITYVTRKMTGNWYSPDDAVIAAQEIGLMCVASSRSPYDNLIAERIMVAADHQYLTDMKLRRQLLEACGLTPAIHEPELAPKLATVTE